MYSTVIKPKQIGITSSAQEKESQRIRQAKARSVTRRLQPQPQRKVNLQAGQFALPVSVQGNSVKMDPTKQGYIKPNFGAENLFTDYYNKTGYSSNVLLSSFSNRANKDIELLKRYRSEDSASKENKDKKVEGLFETRKEIKAEAKKTLVELRKRIKGIHNLKEIHSKLVNLVKTIEEEQ
eukprot:CAMPEP_0170535924 /NCGR_PEP_ID=MMETSP0209-20121228/101865_1 /TAXON_ID=665100 ORGANISM="Litonotus pictus, Strain P1" /NCGR_SAMPLE_ID=MMETSP0209 /ASSEMBLY_ACC=CAM_ASM_000301 /LENGTH=179 /DNA_ID=CAMNT_0010837237 /DNA_START=396 /DNA_END=935 /DNA_ORIENTATION=+